MGLYYSHIMAYLNWLNVYITFIKMYVMCLVGMDCPCFIFILAVHQACVLCPRHVPEK
jgi:hypothetical protein